MKLTYAMEQGLMLVATWNGGNGARINKGTQNALVKRGLVVETWVGAVVLNHEGRAALIDIEKRQCPPYAVREAEEAAYAQQKRREVYRPGTKVEVRSLLDTSDFEPWSGVVVNNKNVVQGAGPGGQNAGWYVIEVNEGIGCPAEGAQFECLAFMVFEI